MKLLLKYILIACMVLFVACRTANKYLNKRELSYGKRRNVEMLHDKKAIEQNKSNGIYKVHYWEYGFALCSMDSSNIKRAALTLSKYHKSIMEYKANYEFMDITMSGNAGENSEIKTTSGELCSCWYTIRLAMKDSLAATIMNGYNTNDTIGMYDSNKGNWRKPKL